MEPEDSKVNPYVSIVLAAYNEERCIKEELGIIKEAMEKSPYTYEIILVDDASTDKTVEIAEREDGISIIKHKENRGSGGARKTGTLAASGEIVVWTDVDMTYPNSEIPRLIDTLEGEAHDQVIGSRVKEKGKYKILRGTVKHIIRKLACYLSETDIPDLNSGMRAFKKEIALKYMRFLPKGFSCVSTMTLAFICNDYSVGFMPIAYRKRIGRSKFHPIKDTQKYITQVIRMVMYFNPLKVFLPLAATLFFIGIVSSIIGWFYFHKIIAANVIVILTSIVIGALGLLADLIVAQHK